MNPVKETQIQENYLLETDLLKEGLLLRLAKVRDLEDRLKENAKENQTAEGFSKYFFGF